MKEINDYILKLTGKVSILESLELGHNYQIKIDSTVTQVTDVDNNDGTLNRVYKIEPIIGEITKDNGETLKIKDARKNSEKIRNRSFAVWSSKSTKIDSDEMYNKVTNWILSNMDSVQDIIIKNMKI